MTFVRTYNWSHHQLVNSVYTPYFCLTPVTILIISYHLGLCLPVGLYLYGSFLSLFLWSCDTTFFLSDFSHCVIFETSTITSFPSPSGKRGDGHPFCWIRQTALFLYKYLLNGCDAKTAVFDSLC
jgi:hypothetical protein